MLLEHPVLLIEKLLKFGLGDKGRLLYLRNVITQGKNIYKSDQIFLEKMELELQKIQGQNLEKNHTNEETKHSPTTSLETFKIQNQILELKKIDSKLMDNLELLVLSHNGSI